MRQGDDFRAAYVTITIQPLYKCESNRYPEVFLPKILDHLDFVVTNGADPDEMLPNADPYEMPPTATFHLGLHCLQAYPFGDF